MPAVLISKVGFSKSYYQYIYDRRRWYHDGAYLIDVFELPDTYVKQFENWEGPIRVFICEIFNDEAKLIHRFTPPQQMDLELVKVPRNGAEYYMLKLPGHFIDKHGLSTRHYLAVICIKMGNTAIFPYEIRILRSGYDSVAEKIASRLREYYEIIGYRTILGIYASLVSGNVELTNIAQFMLDGWLRYLDGDIEGGITQFRKAVQILRDNLLPSVRKIEGIASLRKYGEELVNQVDILLESIENITKTLYHILSIGGPHPLHGFTPRYTCLLAIRMLAGILEYLARVFEAEKAI